MLCHLALVMCVFRWLGHLFEWLARVGEMEREMEGCANPLPTFGRIKEPFMLKFALIAVAASTLLSSSPALAKKVRHRPAQTTHQVAPAVKQAPRYDWQAGDCDVANKAALNTCSNGGR
jgi:hypothetical protein